MADSEQKPGGSFWTTLPGVLTGLTGLVGAIAALLAALSQVGLLSKPADTPPPAITKPDVPKSAPSVAATSPSPPSEAQRHSEVIPTRAPGEGDVYLVTVRTVLHRIASMYDDHPLETLNPGDQVRVIRADPGGWFFVRSAENPTDEGYLSSTSVRKLQ